MRNLKRSLALLLGAEPEKPDPANFSPETRAAHAAQKAKLSDPAVRLEMKDAHADLSAIPTPTRRKRWAVLMGVNLLFVLSFWFDVQLLEGALTGSRFAGFHMADLNASMHVMLASKIVLINLVIGTCTVAALWWLLGGRTFCAWVCPYHLLSEWVEILHLKLSRARLTRDLIKDNPLDRRVRVWVWLIFAILSLVTGYTVYESISPPGLLSRALVYGPGIGLAFVGLLLLVELLYSRRAWCRYLCPMGLTYGFVGATSPLRVHYKLENCLHEAACRTVCLVPHVLDHVTKGRAPDVTVDVGADCTRCGRCVDICQGGALSFKFGLGNKSGAETPPEANEQS